MRAQGFDAEHVYDLQMSGAKDPTVFAYAQSHRAILLTGDKDFSNILAYPPPHAGIIVVEIPDTMAPDARKQAILRQLVSLADQSLVNALAIIEVGRVRVRR